MLVLTRKCQEKIQIGNDITITIVRVKGQSVRVGIEAPREMKVLRTELPPESPADQSTATTTSEQETLAPEAASENCSSEQTCPAAALESENDCRASYRPTAKPLAQYIPGTRMLSVSCGG